MIPTIQPFQISEVETASYKDDWDSTYIKLTNGAWVGFPHRIDAEPGDVIAIYGKNIETICALSINGGPIQWRDIARTSTYNGKFSVSEPPRRQPEPNEYHILEELVTVEGFRKWLNHEEWNDWEECGVTYSKKHNPVTEYLLSNTSGYNPVVDMKHITLESGNYEEFMDTPDWVKAFLRDVNHSVDPYNMGHDRIEISEAREAFERSVKGATNED